MPFWNYPPHSFLGCSGKSNNNYHDTKLETGCKMSSTPGFQLASRMRNCCYLTFWKLVKKTLPCKVLPVSFTNCAGDTVRKVKLHPWTSSPTSHCLHHGSLAEGSAFQTMLGFLGNYHFPLTLCLACFSEHCAQ